MATFVAPAEKCEYFGCQDPVRYRRKSGKREVGYCQRHAPSDIRAFQRIALAVMIRGWKRRHPTPRPKPAPMGAGRENERE